MSFYITHTLCRFTWINEAKTVLIADNTCGRKTLIVERGTRKISKELEIMIHQLRMLKLFAVLLWPVMLVAWVLHKSWSTIGQRLKIKYCPTKKSIYSHPVYISDASVQVQCENIVENITDKLICAELDLILDLT